MNIAVRLFVYFLLHLILTSCRATGFNNDTVILINTTAGDIKVRLYNETPLHRDNFINLVKSGVYNGVIFHRVINEFMIQAGDPSTNSVLTNYQADTLSRYTIPSEFHKDLYHKKGALAAAREGNNTNPFMRSSGTQFYIVQGKKYTDEDLSAIEKKVDSAIKQSMFNLLLKEVSDSVRQSETATPDAVIQDIVSTKMFEYLSTVGDFRFSAEQSDVYKSIGGTPFLDGTYTVFGEVTEGLDTVDKIASSETGYGDKPLSEIKIVKMKILN